MSQNKTLEGSCEVHQGFHEHFRFGANRVLEFCDLLESLADDLPRKSAATWRATKSNCRQELDPHLSSVLLDLLPALGRATTQNAMHQNFLKAFKSDLEEILDRIEDLIDLFDDALAQSGVSIDPETLGFALREHFVSIRRYIRWEKDVLLPLTVQKIRPERLETILCDRRKRFSLVPAFAQ